MEGVEGEARDQLQAALDRSLAMNPLTPDHHFYIDQGTNARLRLAAIAIGRKLTEAGVLDDAEDVVFLHYNEVRLLLADQSALDARELVSDRRDEHEDAAERRPPSWVGTATEEALGFPYASLWGFPEKFHAGEPATTGDVKGLAASPGVVEGTARYVTSLDQFDEVNEGDILVCRMTNPAWVVLFTKIRGLVTEAGGTMSHPAVVAREFGIPAVVGTTNAASGSRPATACGSTAPPASSRCWGEPRSDRVARALVARDALALRDERGDDATVVAGGTFLGILMNQGFLSPSAMLSLGGVDELRGIEVVDGELRLGATVTHREIERDARVREGWPVLAHAFGVVASPRVRNMATIGGVLADADYASDPPAVLQALGARAVLRSARGERAVSVDELILGYYETCIAPDELLVEVRVPAAPERAVYRKFRSRSSEDRPCVAVAAAWGGGELRVVVGAVAETPQHYPDVCALAAGRARPRAGDGDRPRATPSASSRSATRAARRPTAAASPPSRCAARSRRWQ